MKSWLRQHRFAMVDALGRLRKAPGNFLFNMLVVAIALMLPFAGLMLLENIRPLTDELAVDPEISMFLNMDTPRERASALAPEIRSVVQRHQLHGRLEFVPREAALARLKDRTGMSEALEALGGNPLPDGYVLRLARPEKGEDAVRIEQIASDLGALPGVEQVQVDSAWVKRLAALVRLLRLLLALLAATLAVVVIAVVFNTIRLQVMTQREEIEVSRLVGATDAFICRPFYYSGALLGLAAGLAALGGVALSLHPLNDAIAGFAMLYASDFRLAPLTFFSSLLLLGASTGLGLTGALLSVRRHLARIA